VAATGPPYPIAFAGAKTETGWFHLSKESVPASAPPIEISIDVAQLQSGH